MKLCIGKLMGWLQEHHLKLIWSIPYQCFMKRNGYKIPHYNSNWCITEVVSMIFLFYSNLLNTYSIFRIILTPSILIFPFHLKVNPTTKCSFWMQRYLGEMVDSKQLFIVTWLLVVFTLILIAFCQLHLNLVWFKP